MLRKISIVFKLFFFIAVGIFSFSANSETCGVCESSYYSCISNGGDLNSCTRQMHSCRSVCFSGKSSSESNSNSWLAESPIAPVVAGIVMGSLLAVLVFFLVYKISEFTQLADEVASKFILWLSVGIMASFGALILATTILDRDSSPDGYFVFLFLMYVFFCIPHLLLIRWTRWGKQEN
jgi:hypothetical protein